MAKVQKFFNQPLDKTPYGSCGTVAFIVLAFFCASSYGLWTVAGNLKKGDLFHFNFNLKLNTPSAPDNLLQKVQESTENKTEDVQKKVQESIKQEADRQIEQQINTLKTDGENQVKEQITQ